MRKRNRNKKIKITTDKFHYGADVHIAQYQLLFNYKNTNIFDALPHTDTHMYVHGFQNIYRAQH